MEYNTRKEYYEKIAHKECQGVNPEFFDTAVNGFIEGCIYKDLHQNCVICSNHDSNIKLVKAKELIRNIIRVTWGEGWNYNLGWKVEAEKFLEE